MRTDTDRLEPAVRAALRRWADSIPDAPAPLPGEAALFEAHERRRRVHGRVWLAAAAAAAVLVVAGALASRTGGPSQRLQSADGPPASPAPVLDWRPIPTADTVVYHTAFGGGGQQLGRDEQGNVERVPGRLAVAPDERHVYISDPANGRVVSVDTATGRVVRTYPMAGGVREMAVDPTTGDVYTLSDAGVVTATTPAGATRHVMTASSDDDRAMNLRGLDGPPDEAGVYAVTEHGISRLSPGPAVSLKGWPVGGAYMGIGLEGSGTMTAVSRDRAGNVLGEVGLTSERSFPEAMVAVGGVFRVIDGETPDDGHPRRTLLFLVDSRPAVTAVYSLPLFPNHDFALSPHAVWALERVTGGAELHKVAIPTGLATDGTEDPRRNPLGS